MPAELLKTCYAERNPSTLYMKGVQFFFTFNLQEEGLAFMKLAADEGYERAVYKYAMTRTKIWGDEEYFARFTRESVDRIGKLVRSLKWAWGSLHGDEFRKNKGDKMCNCCFWIKEVGLFFREFEPMSVIRDTREW
ncbi:hypothetical protein F2Q69_00060535 [Brassica cretica]|uniref:At2g35280-like TPR domain-containing protein n=1 Tax=Brassica cretica TaxID=69181 RepID=A0A8S9REY1_BRACR|nr:hypothetical protein F2Q69_00060535 [Brassica cretica]